jgi:hypothetical protein
MALKHDLTGMRFGKIVVEGFSRMNDRRHSMWRCRCDCGTALEIERENLTRKRSTRCKVCADKGRVGKTRIRRLELEGLQFGKLTVIERAESNRHGDSMWVCKCSCGNESIVQGGMLTGGYATQCRACGDLSMALNLRGKNNPNWLDGRSHGKYCPRFNAKLKEEIREKYDRECYICGKPEGKRRHSVHHIDYNKVQGCKGMRWSLVPLCASCHSKTNSNRHFWFNYLYPTHVMEGLDNWGELGVV